MLPSRLAHPTAAFGALGARLLPALAAIAAIGAFGAFPAGAPGGAESLYLAFAAGVVLLSAAAVAPRPGVEVAAGALVVTLAAWALPDGPARGAVVMALAAGALAVAAARRFGTVGEGERASAPGWPLSPVAGVGLALGCQVLLRGGELLHAGSALRAAVVFVAFPVAGALAVLALVPLHGRRTALVAGAAAILLAPGFRPASVAALAALAAGSWLFAAGLPAPGGRSPWRILAPAALLLLAPFAWDVRAAAVGLVAGLAAGALAGGGARHWLTRLMAVAFAGVVMLTLAALPGRPAGEALSLASRVVLVVPALLLVTRARAAAVVTALLLAGAAARGVSVDGFLAAPAALAVLAALSRSISGRLDLPGGAFRAAARSAQGAWSTVALGFAALLGAYPWLRPDPFGDLLPRFGLAETPVAALLAALTLAAVAALTVWAPRVRRLLGRDDLPADEVSRAGALSAWAAAAVLAVLLLVHLPPAGAAGVERHPVVLDAGRPEWSAPVDGVGTGGAGGGTVVIDSSLANSVGLEAGTPVATVRLRRAGAPDGTWVLRAGVETGEWAADRPDLRAAGEAAPDVWQSWVAEGGGFFGQRYRAAHRFDVEPDSDSGPGSGPDVRSGEVVVELRDDLPEEVSLTLFHVEVRP